MHGQEQLRTNRTICVPFTQEDYINVTDNPVLFRGYPDPITDRWPEIFPNNILSGYLMKDMKESVKPGLPIRRIKIDGAAHTIRPSFVMPYMTGLVRDVEKGLMLRKYAVPFRVIAYVLGENAMYWQRTEQSLGRNSIAGTTVRDGENLPDDLAADDKHTRLDGEKVYVATTVIPGASVATNADEQSLTDAYGVFKEEALDMDDDDGYTPDTICTDGFPATRNAFRKLFPLATLILCFLHLFIKIRKSRRTRPGFFESVAGRLWHCFHAPGKAAFSQRVRRLHERAEAISLPSAIMRPIEKLRDNLALYAVAYDHPGSHRTGNMPDRLMQRMDRHLFVTRYFHGSLHSAELGIRAWALIMNFAPSTVAKYDGLRSPAARLSQFEYSGCWLENLLISASRGGYRRPPHKA